MTPQKCSAPDCVNKASVEVVLYDVYHNGEVFFEQDETCPFLCTEHVIENEQDIQGERKPRGVVSYPFSNKNGAQGFSIYRPIA